MVRIRAQLAKGPEARFISHLDLVRALERALRRTGLPVAYSEGFNPHPKIAFASALPLGATSEAEYFDVIFSEPVLPRQFELALNEQLPLGLRVIEAREVSLRGPALMAAIDVSFWEVAFPAPPGGRAAVAEAIERLLGQGACVRVHQAKHGDREIDILPLIDQIDLVPEGDSPEPAAAERGDGQVRIVMGLAAGARGSVRPEEVVAALADLGGFSVERGDIELKRLAMAAGRGTISPWDV